MRTDRLSSIFFHINFVIRRLVFTLIAVFASEYLFVQMYALLVTSSLQMMYLIIWKPFDSEFMNRIEIFNEFTTILLSYVLFLFSPANLKYDDSNFYYDMAFIAVLGSNILVHCAFLTIDSVKGIVKKIKNKCCKSKTEMSIQHPSTDNSPILRNKTDDKTFVEVKAAKSP